MIFFYTLEGSHNSVVSCYRLFSIYCYVRTIVSLPSVTSSQRFSVRKQVRRFISVAFPTFQSLYVSTFARHCSALPKVFSVLVLSYDKSTSWYDQNGKERRELHYAYNLLVFSCRRNLLSHCSRSVCLFGVLPYVTHVPTYGISFFF